MHRKEQLLRDVLEIRFPHAESLERPANEAKVLLEELREGGRHERKDGRTFVRSCS